jgi:hypothetical protein
MSIHIEDSEESTQYELPEIPEGPALESSKYTTDGDS